MRCWRTALLGAAMLISDVFSGGILDNLYQVGESGRSGTAVIASPVVSSIILCGAACSASSYARMCPSEFSIGGKSVCESRFAKGTFDMTQPNWVMSKGFCVSVPDCVGFNWRSSTRGCDLLSSLSSTVADPSCTIYAADVIRTPLPLLFSCPTCMGSPPWGTWKWKHDCPNGGVVVGVASNFSLSDLDYLLCIHSAKLTLDYSNGAYVHNDRICTQVMGGRPFPAIGLWADEQFYNAPRSLRYHCREIISGQKMDMTRCMEPKSSVGVVQGLEGPGHQLLVCPPHMVAARFFWNSTALALSLTCCPLYI